VSDVAVLGTGRMGGAMARSLARNGFVLTLYNRTPEKAAELAAELGAQVAPDAASAVAAASVAISMVADEAAVTDLYRCASGVLEGLAAGTTLLEMSTVPPHVARALEPDVRARGAAILDAPVSGSVTLAESGSLTIMAGGAAADVERVRPVLDALATTVFHMGPLGSGATIKLAVNSVIFALNESLAEALVLAERAGVERTRAYEVFAASAIAAPFTKYKQAAFVDPGSVPTAFALGLAAKDLELILELARQSGAPMPQAEVNLANVRESIAAVGADADLSAVAEALRR
jgi:3-hydroxyisobutyrate dehydrogenase-like beta-hydroxyacid dehydrogenase